MTLPDLAAHEGSWVVTSPAGRTLEIFRDDRPLAEKAMRYGWRVETIGAYLGRINREIREAAPPKGVRT